jgi:two-component system, chemotaxis family, chemotaxis protein CheY
MTPSSKRRALIADDERHIRTLLKSLLEKSGFEVVGEAANGEEAVDLYMLLQPELMLLDINMPFKTGIEALQDIMKQFPQALVIMLTSLADRESVEQCIKAGAANFIRKDTSLSNITLLIEKTWKSREGGEEAEDA